MSDLRHLFTREFWDQRYAESHRVWSGRPNPRLVELVADLAPGTALDVGCGEGADIVWLAQQGWRVTGVDLSDVALERAEQHAKDAGVGIQTAFLRVDALADDELPGPVDLVSAQYFHAPRGDLEAFVARLGRAVNPGGMLVVVGHHPDDAATGLRNPELSSLLFTPEDVTGVLDPETWDLGVAEPRTRDITTDEGRDVVVTDTVVLAVRR